MKTTGNSVADGMFDGGFGPHNDHYGPDKNEDTSPCDVCGGDYPESEVHKLLSLDIDTCVHCVKYYNYSDYYDSDLTPKEAKQLYWELQKINNI